MTASDPRVGEIQACESHHWVSTNVPGLLARWVIQCSLCGAYNAQEMNAHLLAQLRDRDRIIAGVIATLDDIAFTRSAARLRAAVAAATGDGE